MKYVPMYSKIVTDIEKLLETKPQVFIEDTKLTKYAAKIIAQDLNLSCIRNTVLKRYYFRKASYKKLTINETFIH